MIKPNQGPFPQALPIEQPAGTPEALRAAVALVLPDSLTAFDAERAEAPRRARTDMNAAPLRRFIRQWAVSP